VIGIQYLVTAFIFYLIGGFMAVLMRTELATANADFLNPDLYNAFLTNHGTIMIFLWIVPAAIGGFGNLPDSADDWGAGYGLPQA
jgi:cytochrome c oxidase subunit 1